MNFFVVRTPTVLTAALALEALSEALTAEELTALCSMVDRDDVILDK